MNTYMIIDDEAYWREAVRLALTRPCIQQNGDRIFTAKNESEAIQALEELDKQHLSNPIVFIDVVFPNDANACRKICVETKMNRRYAMPIVMTAAPNAENFRAAINNGYVGYIAKAIDPSIFEPQVWTMVERAVAMQKQLESHENAIRQLRQMPEYRDQPNLQSVVDGVRKAFERLTCSDYGDISW